jgi:acetyltransferase
VRAPGDAPEIVAVGRLSKEHGTDSAEMAALVSDPFQGQGLGTELYRRLLQFARDEGVKRVHSTILRENREMRAVCERLGFQFDKNWQEQTVEAELSLEDAPPLVVAAAAAADSADAKEDDGEH